MPRPTQRIHIYAVQDRRSNLQTTRPWVVRWSVEGRERSRSFRRKGEAERYPVDSVDHRPDGTLEVRLAVASERWLERLLLRLGAAGRVIEPTPMADLGRAAAARVLARYG